MALALTDKGRLPLWRKFRDDWKWKNPLYRSAWVWMLLEARFKDDGFLKAGQLRFSVCWGPKEWGMSISQTKRFLDKCVREGDISWQKGFGGKNRIDFHGSQSGSQSGNESASQCGSQLAIITILKYDEYNNHTRKRGSQSGNESASQSVTAMEVLLRKDKGKVQGKVQVPPPPEAEAIVLSPKKQRHRDYQATSDHIWETYQAKYGYKPKVTPKSYFDQLDDAVTEYGATLIVSAWDIYLSDDSGIALKCGHNPQTFLSGVVLTGYLAQAKRGGHGGKGEDYIDRWVKRQNAKEGKKTNEGR